MMYVLETKVLEVGRYTLIIGDMLDLLYLKGQN